LKTLATAVAALFLAASLAPAADLKEFKSAGGKFTVKMPGDPKESKQKTAVGDLVMHTVELPEGAYSVQWVDIPATAKEDEATLKKRLEGARDGGVGAVGGKVLADKEIKLGDKYPGRDFTGDIPAQKGLLRCRVYFVDGRLYQVMVVGKKEFVEGKDTNAFLDSFALIKEEKKDK